MSTSLLPLSWLSPRASQLPVVPTLTELGLPRLTCLDNVEATVPVLGWLFNTSAASDRQLLRELYRGYQQLRPLSVLDVVDLLIRAGGYTPALGQRLAELGSQQAVG